MPLRKINLHFQGGVLQMIPFKLGTTAAMAATLLTGCLGPTSTQPMVSNPDAYSTAYFAREKLPEASRRLLPALNAEPLGFKRLVVKGRTIGADAEANKARPITFEQSYLNEGDSGAVRILARTDSNGIPVDYYFSSSYRGLVPAAWQRARTGEWFSYPILYSRGDQPFASLADIKEKTDYRFDYKAATPELFDLGVPRSLRCASGVFYDAATFRPGIPGRAIDLTCRHFDEKDVMVAETAHVFLTAFGLALDLSTKRAQASDRYEYDSVVVE